MAITAWSLFLKKVGSFIADIASDPKNLALVALIGLCVFLFLSNKSLQLEIASKKTDIANIKSDYSNLEVTLNTEKLKAAQLKVDNEKLISLIDEQNLKVRELAAEKQRIDKEIAESKKKNAELKQVYEKRIDRILKADIKPECASALNWAIENAQELGKW